HLRRPFVTSDTCFVERRELFLAAMDAFKRGDAEEVRRLTHPDFVLHPIRAGMTGDYHGHRGLERFNADNAETFEVFEPDYDEFAELEDGRPLATGSVRIRGLGSHVETQIATAGIAAFRDGLLAGWHDYGDRAAAREAAGFSP